MAQKDDLNVGRIALIALVSVLVLVATVMFLQVLYYGYHQGMMAEPEYDQLPAEMTNYVANQKGKLVSLDVADKEREAFIIPIDHAQQLVVKELMDDPQAHVTGVPDPEPAASPESEPANGDQLPGNNTSPDDDTSAGTQTSPATTDAAENGTTKQPDDDTPETPPRPDDGQTGETTQDQPPRPSDPATESSAPRGGEDQPVDTSNNSGDEESPPAGPPASTGEEVGDVHP